jgi:hypothetical protein
MTIRFIIFCSEKQKFFVLRQAAILPSRSRHTGKYKNFVFFAFFFLFHVKAASTKQEKVKKICVLNEEL